MNNSKEELIQKIEGARKKLNDSIEQRTDYDIIYRNSVELDELINLYIVSGF